MQYFDIVWLYFLFTLHKYNHHCHHYYRQPVSVQVCQTWADHQVAQVAVVCCEVIVSWALQIFNRDIMLLKAYCGMRMAKDVTRAVFPVRDPEEEIVYIPDASFGGLEGVWPDHWGDVGGQDDVLLNATSHIQTLLPAGTSLIRKRVTKNSFVGKNQYLVHSSPVPCRRTGWRGGPVVLIICKGT